jgi:hypothetical protein
MIGPGAGVRGPNPTLSKLRRDSFVTEFEWVLWNLRTLLMLTNATH